MTTLDFLIAALIVFLVMEVCMRLLAPLIMRQTEQQLRDWAGPPADKNIALTFPVIGRAIFALIFAFLLFQYSDQAGEIGLWSGSVFGLFVGIVSVVPQSLLLIATVGKLQSYQMRLALTGVICSLLAGVAVSFYL